MANSDPFVCTFNDTLMAEVGKDGTRPQDVAVFFNEHRMCLWQSPNNNEGVERVWLEPSQVRQLLERCKAFYDTNYVSECGLGE